MKIQTENAQVYSENLLCDKCGRELTSTSNNKIRYEYKCIRCGEKKKSSLKYPRFFFKDGSKKIYLVTDTEND